MAACGGLEHIFEKSLPRSSRPLASLSPWEQIKSLKTVTQILDELHFKENHVADPSESSTSFSSSPLSSPSSSSLSWTSMFFTDAKNGGSSIHQERSGSSASSFCPDGQRKQYRHSDSFSSMNSDSLSICTEGLGLESFDDVEELMRIDVCSNDWQPPEERATSLTIKAPAENENQWGETKRSRTNMGAIPPPIPCIGLSGKPGVWLKSFREDGRFILKEIMIPTQEMLHACRENGRLKLKFIPSDDEIFEEVEKYDKNIEENDKDTGKNDDGDRRGSVEMEKGKDKKENRM